MKLAIIGAGEQASEIFSLITNSKSNNYYEAVMRVDLEADAQKILLVSHISFHFL